MRPYVNPFDYINKTYNLSVKKGSKVIYQEGTPEQAEGEITGVEGAYLLIKMAGKKIAQPYHPTWALKHLPA